MANGSGITPLTPEQARILMEAIKNDIYIENSKTTMSVGKEIMTSIEAYNKKQNGALEEIDQKISDLEESTKTGPLRVEALLNQLKSIMELSSTVEASASEQARERIHTLLKANSESIERYVRSYEERTKLEASREERLNHVLEQNAQRIELQMQAEERREKRDEEREHRRLEKERADEEKARAKEEEKKRKEEEAAAKKSEEESDADRMFKKETDEHRKRMTELTKQIQFYEHYLGSSRQIEERSEKIKQLQLRYEAAQEIEDDERGRRRKLYGILSGESIFDPKSMAKAFSKHLSSEFKKHVDETYVRPLTSQVSQKISQTFYDYFDRITGKGKPISAASAATGEIAAQRGVSSIISGEAVAATTSAATGEIAAQRGVSSIISGEAVAATTSTATAVTAGAGAASIASVIIPVLLILLGSIGAWAILGIMTSLFNELYDHFLKKTGMDKYIQKMKDVLDLPGLPGGSVKSQSAVKEEKDDPASWKSMLKRLGARIDAVDDFLQPDDDKQDLTFAFSRPEGIQTPIYQAMALDRETKAIIREKETKQRVAALAESSLGYLDLSKLGIESAEQEKKVTNVQSAAVSSKEETKPKDKLTQLINERMPASSTNQSYRHAVYHRE